MQSFNCLKVDVEGICIEKRLVNFFIGVICIRENCFFCCNILFILVE